MEEKEIEKFQKTLMKLAEIVHRQEMQKLKEAIRLADVAIRTAKAKANYIGKTSSNFFESS